MRRLRKKHELAPELQRLDAFRVTTDYNRRYAFIAELSRQRAATIHRLSRPRKRGALHSDGLRMPTERKRNTIRGHLRSPDERRSEALAVHARAFHNQ
jgi:hypothetical protein